MFTAKPTALALTLVFYIALALVLTTGSDAKGYAPVPVHRRDHLNLNRLIKKRAPQLPNDFGAFSSDGSDTSPANNAGADPLSDTVTPSASSAAAQSTPTPSNTPARSKNVPASSSTPSASASVSLPTCYF
jgi:hypothetical protein